MTGNLDEALVALLRSALPSLFGGASPPVAVEAAAGDFVLDATSADAEAGQPRSDAVSDTLPFDAAMPAGPYTLSRSPDDSVRKVRLTTAAGDRIALHDDEIVFDALDARRFSLALRATRDLAAANAVLVMYGATGVYAQLKYRQELSLDFDAPDAALRERAQTLAMAVLALHRTGLLADAAKSELADGYGAQIVLKMLHFAGGDTSASGRTRLKLSAEFELKAYRTLADGEGRPIAHIRSAGRTGARPIDIAIQMEA